MDELSMINNSTQDEDYIDQLSSFLPWNRPLTPFERLAIVTIVTAFVTAVGCFILYLICAQSSFGKRKSRNKSRREASNALNTNKDIVIVPPSPPSYESAVQSSNTLDINRLAGNPYLHSMRKTSNGTVSDTDGLQSHSDNEYLSPVDGRLLRSQSARSSLTNIVSLSTISNTYPLSPYAQIHIEVDINIIENLLTISMTKGEHFLRHPAFDEQADYFIRVQLVDNKMLKTFHDERKKRRSGLSLALWRKRQEKTTKNLSRASDDTITCDEQIQLQCNRNDITSSSLRFLLICGDRSGFEDFMFESLLPLNASMIPKHQQIIEFKNLPQIYFGELFLALSYLPTSERFTININKLRYFGQLDKTKNFDVRITVTLLHNGRRFSQKKIPIFIHDSKSDDYEITNSITEKIPQNDIRSIYVHVEFNSKDNSIIPSSSILFGQQTRYESDWHKMLEYPRQTHHRWYPLFG